MRMILLTGLLGSMLLSCILFTPVVAQETQQEKPRVYKHDFEGQDLSDRDFSKLNLDNTNFADAILKNTKFERSSLKNCNFKGAKLEYTILSYADMTGSDFREASFHYPSIVGANFNGANLSGIDVQGSTSEIKFREANLRNTKGFKQIYGSDYYKADLRGADFSTAIMFERTNFNKAIYDQFTRWPKSFVAKDHGVVFVETKPEEKDSPKSKPTAGGERNDADFQKLDKNEDGVLSGSEMKGLDTKDADADGEVTLTEFLGTSLKRKSEMQKGNPDLLGVWQAVSIENGGKKAPAEMAKLFRMTFRKDALIVRGNHKDEKEDRCSYKIDDSKTPKQFEFSMEEEPLPVLGIYRIENGILEICTRRPETKLGRPESFDASKDDSLVHMKLERLDSE